MYIVQKQRLTHVKFVRARLFPLSVISVERISDNAWSRKISKFCKVLDSVAYTCENLP